MKENSLRDEGVLCWVASKCTRFYPHISAAVVKSLGCESGTRDFK